MTDEPDHDQRPGDWRPVPDPTVLTTEALHREITGVRRSIHDAVSRLEVVLVTRIDGVTRVDDEKFIRVDRQFALVEQQRVEQKSDTQKAVDAALAAQKEAVKEQTNASDRAIAKSEAATSRQLEQLAATFAAAFEGLRRDIDGLKERLGGMESRLTGIEQQKLGGREAASDRRASNAAVYALGGFILTLLLIGGVLAGFAALR